MPTVVLVRHGRTTANAAGILAGRTPGIHLDDAGRAQADALAERLMPVKPAGVLSSPLDRCMETAGRIAGSTAEVVIDDRLTECDYGKWTGRQLSELRDEKLWRVVQDHPSGASFPGGESLRAVQTRAVEAVRDHDARLASEAGPRAVWVAVSHGDVIKAVVADALGLHLDLFQRLVIDPGSVTVISYTERRPFVVRVNDVGGDLAHLRSSKRGLPPADDAVVGGGLGTRSR